MLKDILVVVPKKVLEQAPISTSCIWQSWSQVTKAQYNYVKFKNKIKLNFKKKRSQSSLGRKKDKFVKREIFTNALLLCSKVQCSIPSEGEVGSSPDSSDM